MFTRIVKAEVKIPVSTAYIDQFLKMKCFLDVLPFFKPTNLTCKEISESMGAFSAVKKQLGEDQLRNRNVCCLIIGDGNLPRTGSLFAHRSNWIVNSIDPALKIGEKENFKAERLYWVPYKVEEIAASCIYDRTHMQWNAGATNGVINFFGIPDTVVVVAVHSHAALTEACKLIMPKKRLVVVAMPCCKKQEIVWHSDKSRAINPSKEYQDDRILSQQNMIKIWDFDNDSVIGKVAFDLIYGE